MKNPKVEDKTSEVVNRWLSEVRMRPMVLYVFDGDSDFKALQTAETFARNKGYSVGSLDENNPIGLSANTDHVGKWHNIFHDHRRQLSGFIVSHDFRSGPCAMVIFKKVGWM